MGRKPRKDTESVVKQVMEGDFFDVESRQINGMTDLQIKTCNEFVRNGGNMSKAVRKHHKVTTNMAAHTQASRYLRDDICLAYIKRRVAEEGLPARIVDVFSNALGAEIVFNGVATGEPDHRVRMSAAMNLLKVLARPFQYMGQKDDAPSQEIGNVYVQLADEEPVEVLQWMMEHKGRMPTPAERQKILCAAPSSTRSKNGNGSGR